MTFEEFARLLGIPVTTTHDLASGKYEPSMARLRRISKSLDINVGDLVGDS